MTVQLCQQYALYTITSADVTQLYVRNINTYTKRTALESDVVSNKNNFSAIWVLRGLHCHVPSKHTYLVSAYNSELLQ
jgi:dTDP-4-dehydrorhamnose 3,5-epimerase-like enzyme